MDPEPRDRAPAQDVPMREQPVEGTASGASAARLLTSRGFAHQRHQHRGQHATTTDTPTRVLTSVRTPTLTPRRSSGGRRRILPQQPCCCATVRRRSPRSNRCASN
jgi:hypothetical protein